MRIDVPKAVAATFVALALILGGNHCAVFAVITGSGNPAYSCCDAEPAVTPDCSQCCDHLAAPLPSTPKASTDLAGLPLLAILPEALSQPFDPLVGVTGFPYESPPNRFFVEYQFGSGLGSLAPPVFVS